VPTFDEGAIRFDFGPRWVVEKWDASPVYLRGVHTLNGTLTGPAGDTRPEGTKAVDFVGVLDEGTLYLLEVKDFRGHGIENKRRQLQDLPLEIGLKVRDTLAGLVGAYVKTGSPPWVERCGAALAARKHQVRVVAWIVDDPLRPNEPRGKRAARSSERTKQLRQKLGWLTQRVLVEDPFDKGIPDVDVVSLPGAGRR
jgi:hypothetical protein